VTSGSDDGNFFIWRKDTAAIAGVYEGDSSVVNVIEGHPHLPVVAVSGIDTTVKVSDMLRTQILTLMFLVVAICAHTQLQNQSILQNR
jgi:WD40 repeat protein